MFIGTVSYSSKNVVNFCAHNYKLSPISHAGLQLQLRVIFIKSALINSGSNGEKRSCLLKLPPACMDSPVNSLGEINFDMQLNCVYCWLSELVHDYR